MRPKIRKHDLREEFEWVKTLDEGGGNGPGALNGGVFVVKRKVDGLHCVEKRVPSSEVPNGILTKELITLRSLEHPNITQYIDAFITIRSQPPAAFLYMEYCDLGSLADLIKKYRTREEDHACIPESFVWHTFHCMLKALAYLHHGIRDGRDFSPVQDWKPFLHRDIKPHNIFIKTADRGGKYPSIVLGDFGIAIREGDPDWGLVQACGTFAWQPPELPDHDIEGKGDVWAAGAVIHSMCRLDDGPVGKPPSGVSREAWERDPRSRKPKSAGSSYSVQLSTTLAAALTLDKYQRPTAGMLLLELKDLFIESDTKWKHLPSWVFR